MATIAELRQALSDKRRELKQLEADLPKFERLQAQAHEEAVTARRAQNLGQRLELHTRHTQLVAVYAEQEDAVDSTRALIAELEQELADALEVERVEKVIAWVKDQQRKGAEAFAAAVKPLRVAQEAFNAADEAIARERALRPARALESKLMQVQSFGFSSVRLHGKGAQVRLDRFALRLKRDGHGDLFPDLVDRPV